MKVEPPSVASNSTINGTCPKCGGATGYFIGVVISYTQSCYWDGDAYASDENPASARGGKRKYCSDCRKDITKYVDKLQGGQP